MKLKEYSDELLGLVIVIYEDIIDRQLKSKDILNIDFIFQSQGISLELLRQCRYKSDNVKTLQNFIDELQSGLIKDKMIKCELDFKVGKLMLDIYGIDRYTTREQIIRENLLNRMKGI